MNLKRYNAQTGTAVLGEVSDEAFSGWEGVSTSIANGASSLWSGIKSGLGTIADGVRSAYNYVTDGISNTATGIVNLFGSATAAIAGLWRGRRQEEGEGPIAVENEKINEAIKSLEKMALQRQALISELSNSPALLMSGDFEDGTDKLYKLIDWAKDKGLNTLEAILGKENPLYKTLLEKCNLFETDSPGTNSWDFDINQLPIITDQMRKLSEKIDMSKYSDTEKAMVFHILAEGIKYDSLLYKLGGDGSNGEIDCTHYMNLVFQNLGMIYKYTATADFKNSSEIKSKFDEVAHGTFADIYKNKDLKPGDTIVTYGKDIDGKQSGHAVIFLGYDKMGNPIVTQSTAAKDKTLSKPVNGVRPAGIDGSNYGYQDGKKVETWVYRFKK